MRFCVGSRVAHIYKSMHCPPNIPQSLPISSRALDSFSLPFAMAVLTRSFDSLRSYVASFTWAPFLTLSRSSILGLLQRIQVGQLLVTDCDGTVTVCGRPGIKDGSPRTELRVLKESFWIRVLLFTDMVRRIPRSLLGPGS